MIFGTDPGMGDVVADLQIRERMMRALAGSSAPQLEAAVVPPAEPTRGTWSIEPHEDQASAEETNLVRFPGGKVPA